MDQPQTTNETEKDTDLPNWVQDNPVVGSPAAAAPVGDLPSAGKPAPAAAKPTSAPAAAPAAPSTPAAPPAAPVADELDDAPQPRRAEDWKAFKAKQKERRAALEKERDTVQAQVKALTTELEAAKKTALTPASAPEIEALRKELAGLKTERDTLDARLKVVDLANHPQFKSYYTDRINAQIERARAIAGKELAPAIEKLLAQPQSDARDEQLDSLLADLTPMKSGQLSAIATRVGELQSERDAELAKASENAARIETERMARAKADTTAREKFVADTLAELRGTDEFKDVVNDAEVDLTRRIALGGTKDPKDMLRLFLRGLSYSKTVAALAERDKTIADLRAEVTALKAAEPRATAGAPGAERARETDADPVDDMRSAFSKAFE